MEEPGCPLCRLEREQERRYFFWFFAENYHAPETLASLVASHGFCQQHASRLAACGEDRAAAIGVVYELVSRKVAAELAAELGRERPTWPVRSLGRCPACASRERAERRFLEALAEVLRDSRVRSRYHPPHLLCQSHLRRLEPLLRVDDLRHVLEVHLAWLGNAGSGADAGSGRSAGDAGAGAAEGAASAESTWPSPLVRDVDLADVALAPGDAADDRLDVERAVGGSLDDAERCPACVARSEALRAWQRYCQAHVADVAPIDDLLPACDVHVSLFLERGSPELRAAILRHLAGRVRDTLARTLTALQEEVAGGGWRWRLSRLLSGAREPPELRARGTLRRAVPCPVCAMLATTEVRALDLFDVLVRARPGAERYARGHGLCLRHLRAATARGADPDAARALLQHARVDAELLAWRLREGGRLGAWNVRPLPAVPDEAAWRSALYRYVGELT